MRNSATTALPHPTTHALDRYRERVSFRERDPAAAIRDDLAAGIWRCTPPRWWTGIEPGEHYVRATGGATPGGCELPERRYLVRDGVGVTVLAREPERSREESRFRDLRRQRRRGKTRYEQRYAYA